MTNIVFVYASAIALGALHAFEPGHGKTLIAAYMVGTKGRAMDGILLGAIVTATHTFSVILLGGIASLLSTTYSEAVLHNWLGLVSAGLVILVGAWMLRQRLSGRGYGHAHLFAGDHHHHEHEPGHSHEHHHPHAHPHLHEHGEGHGHTHEGEAPHQHAHPHHHPHAHAHTHDGYHAHPHPHAQPQPAHQPGAKGMAELLLLGISGGIIPCPGAIAILLAAVATGKLAQGLSVTLFFSLGLGGVMMGLGVAMSQSKRLTNRVSQNLEFARRMGIASAGLIIAIGSYTMVHSLRNILAS